MIGKIYHRKIQNYSQQKTIDKLQLKFQKDTLHFKSLIDTKSSTYSSGGRSLEHHPN